MRSFIIMATLASASLLAAACNIVGPAAYFIGGPAKVKPKYELPKDRPTVVFIDDRANVLPTRASRQKVAQTVERALLDAKATGKKGEFIASDSVLAFAGRERFGKPTGIAEVGETVGAETVVYATIDSFGLSANGVEFSPIASARIKVIDVKTRKRLWPGVDREWTPVEVKSPTRMGTAPSNNAERTGAEEKLAEDLGTAIARQFIEYTPEEVSQRVGE